MRKRKWQASQIRRGFAANGSLPPTDGSDFMWRGLILAFRRFWNDFHRLLTLFWVKARGSFWICRPMNSSAFLRHRHKRWNLRMNMFAGWFQNSFCIFHIHFHEKNLKHRPVDDAKWRNGPKSTTVARNRRTTRSDVITHYSQVIK